MTERSGRHAWQRTKIVCTLGPATDAPGVLEALVRSGMDVARINMSHGTHADHVARIESVRRVSRALSEPVGILVDLPGPKFRLGELAGGSRRLEDGTTVVLPRKHSTPSACLSETASFWTRYGQANPFISPTARSPSALRRLLPTVLHA